MPGISVKQVEDLGAGTDPHKKGESIIESGWGSNRPSKEGNNKGGIGKIWEITNKRGVSLFGDNSLPILMDGVKFTSDDYDFILYTPAFEIESVELLRPWQTLAYTNGAINGAILVKTRAYKDRPPLPSKGAMYTPTGISKLDGTFQPEKWIANQSGLYRLIVDVFTDKEIRSYEHRFEVVEDKDM